MARARQEGSSPEPVEGLARDGPRPLPAWSPGALGRVLRPSASGKSLLESDCSPRAAAGGLLPASSHSGFPAPLPRPGPPRPPRGSQLEGGPVTGVVPCPAPRGPLEGVPTPAAPGVWGEEEQWAREIVAQLRWMAYDLYAQYERRQEEQQRHRPSPWRVLYNLLMGLLPLPRGPGAPEMEPN
uniref:BCL2 binding component 3 n=1 Tax=Oryctolagus cuniculus TaxID=9986 RepID=A0A5F9DGT6_RABIT